MIQPGVTHMSTSKPRRRGEKPLLLQGVLLCPLPPNLRWQKGAGEGSDILGHTAVC